MVDNNECSNLIAFPVEHKNLQMDGYGIHYYISGKENVDSIIFLHPAFSDHRDTMVNS